MARVQDGLSPAGQPRTFSSDPEAVIRTVGTYVLVALAVVVAIPTVAILCIPAWLMYQGWRYVRSTTSKHCRRIQDRRLEWRRERSRQDVLRPAKVQEISMLLGRLPLELRQQIYDGLYEHRCQDVVLRRQNINAKVVGRESVMLPETYAKHLLSTDCRPRTKPKRLLGFALACRQTYSETIGYLRERTCLHIVDDPNRGLLELRQILSPQHFQQLRSLGVAFGHYLIPQVSGFCGTGRPGQLLVTARWYALCADLKEIPGLERLHVQTAFIGGDLLRPLMSFTHLKEFLVDYQSRDTYNPSGQNRGAFHGGVRRP